MTIDKTILLVEDDPAISLIIRETLGDECALFAAVGSIAERNAWLADHRPDLIITDVVLPDGDGIDSLPGAGVAPETPVIVLSAQNTLDTAVRAQGIGSYDYLPKPFDLDELEARVRALARRGQPAPTAALHYGPLRVDPDAGAVYCQDTVMDLAPRESAMLRALMHKPGHAVAKDRLFEVVFDGDSQAQPEAIEVVAYRLRKRLAGTGVQLITLRGLGYLLKNDA